MLLQLTIQCPAAAAAAYKFSSTIKSTTVYQGITGFIDSRAALARLLGEVASQLPVQAPASSHCLHQPALPAQSQPGDADGIHPGAQGSPALKGQDRSSRRPWSSKSEIPHELESKQPEVLNMDQSKRGNLKRESKPELCVEA